MVTASAIIRVVDDDPRVLVPVRRVAPFFLLPGHAVWLSSHSTAASIVFSMSLRAFTINLLRRFLGTYFLLFSPPSINHIVHFAIARSTIQAVWMVAHSYIRRATRRVPSIIILFAKITKSTSPEVTFIIFVIHPF
jgi:hypothetical protein